MEKIELNRRSFLKTSAVCAASCFTGASTLTSLTSCGSRSDWQAGSFPKILLHNFQLFNGKDNYLKKGSIILIEKDKITGVEPRADLTQYKDFKHFDLNNMTLLPGLIDNHVHLTAPFVSSGNFKVLLQKNEQFELNFRNCIMSGVTTVRDVGGFPEMINKLKSRADINKIPGPRVISSLSMIAAREGMVLGWPVQARYIDSPILKWVMGGNFVERPRTLEEVNEVCEEMIRLGAVWLKTLHHDQSLTHKPYKIPNHTDDEYRAILANGKKHNLGCAMHAMLASGFKKGVDLGYDTLEHTPMDMEIDDQYIDRFTENGSAIIPTISLFADFLAMGEIKKLLTAKGQQYLQPEALMQIKNRITGFIKMENTDKDQEKSGNLPGDPLYFKEMFPNVIKNVKKLYVAGAKIGAGTDSGGTSFALFGFFHDELKHLSMTGISNFEVLKMATENNSRILKMQDKIGTIEKGKWADLIAVEGDPLLDIETMKNVRMVMKGGAFIKKEGVSGFSS